MDIIRGEELAPLLYNLLMSRAIWLVAGHYGDGAPPALQPPRIDALVGSVGTQSVAQDDKRCG